MRSNLDVFPTADVRDFSASSGCRAFLRCPERHFETRVRWRWCRVDSGLELRSARVAHGGLRLDQHDGPVMEMGERRFC